MWSKETSIKIANILNFIAEPPNVRPHPLDASIKVFDGGIIEVITGLERYKFTDGTEAIYGMGRNIHLKIVFPNGEEISLGSSFLYCGGCLNPISTDAKYCRQCGLKNSW